MFEPKSRVAARPLALKSLVNAQHGVDRDVAVGMDADLPVVLVRLFCRRVELVFSHDFNPEVVRAANVSLRQVRSALADRAIGDHFHRADADPFISKTGANPGGEHLIDLLVTDQAVDPDGEIA